MKKFLLVLALSMAVGVVNASRITIVNKTEFALDGTVTLVGLCTNDKSVKLKIKPKSSETFDANICCANSLEFKAKGGYEGELKWGEISFCGEQEKFEISVYSHDFRVLEIKNITSN